MRLEPLDRQVQDLVQELVRHVDALQPRRYLVQDRARKVLAILLEHLAHLDLERCHLGGLHRQLGLLELGFLERFFLPRGYFEHVLCCHCGHCSSPAPPPSNSGSSCSVSPPSSVGVSMRSLSCMP